MAKHLSADAWSLHETVSIGKDYITGPDGKEVPCLSIRTYDGDDFIAIVEPSAMAIFMSDIAATIADVIGERG